MPALVFDKCCLCIDLKTGCFIIGYMNLIGIIVLNIVTAVGLAAVAVVASDTTDPDYKDNQDVSLAATILLAIIFIFLLIALAFAIVLLVGLHKNKPGHLKAYLVYSVILLVVTIIQFIVRCVNAKHTPNAGGAIAKDLFSILILCYFLLVIRSMYFRMKDPSRGPAIYSAA